MGSGLKAPVGPRPWTFWQCHLKPHETQRCIRVKLDCFAIKLFFNDFHFAFAITNNAVLKFSLIVLEPLFLLRPQIFRDNLKACRFYSLKFQCQRGLIACPFLLFSFCLSPIEDPKQFMNTCSKLIARDMHVYTDTHTHVCEFPFGAGIYMCLQAVIAEALTRNSRSTKKYPPGAERLNPCVCSVAAFLVTCLLPPLGKANRLSSFSQH